MTHIAKQTSEIELQGSNPSSKVEPSPNYGLIGSNAAALVLLAQIMAQYGNDLTRLNSEMQAKMAQVLGGLGANDSKGLLAMYYDAAADQGVQAAHGLSAQMTGAIIGLSAGVASSIGLVGVSGYKTMKTTGLNEDALALQKTLKGFKPEAEGEICVNDASSSTTAQNATHKMTIDTLIAKRADGYKMTEDQAAVKTADIDQYSKLMQATHEELAHNSAKLNTALQQYSASATAFNQAGSSSSQMASASMQQQPEIDKAKDQAQSTVLETVQRQTGQSIDAFQRTAIDSHADANKAANDLASALQGQGRA
jgi:hypothetical protein